MAVGFQVSLERAKPHGAAEVATGFANFQLVAAHPLTHFADYRLRGFAELGGAGNRNAGE